MLFGPLSTLEIHSPPFAEDTVSIFLSSTVILIEYFPYLLNNSCILTRSPDAFHIAGHNAFLSNFWFRSSPFWPESLDNFLFPCINPPPKKNHKKHYSSIDENKNQHKIDNISQNDSQTRLTFPSCTAKHWYWPQTNFWVWSSRLVGWLVVLFYGVSTLSG